MARFVREFVRAIRLKVKKIRMTKSHISKLVNASSNIFLELGAGDKKGENGWVTIDMKRKCDIYWDLRNGIPFPDESVAKIYSSHFFEHLTYKEIQKFLTECLRVLKPGGTFSICVPNAKLYLEAYALGKSLSTDHFIVKEAFNNTTKIDYVNYCAYLDGEHKYMFDEENLTHILREKGMRNVRLRGFDPGLDNKYRDFESIYAEAEK